MRRFALFLLAAALLAQKKPVTLESITAQRPPRAAVSPIWAPDGQHFAVVEDRALWLHEVLSGEKKELVKLAALEEKAATVPPPERFGWVNRGVREDNVQWAASGREMLVRAGGDLFLLRPENGAWEQLSHTPETEHDPKLSPDGRAVSFRRGHDLYTLDVATRKITRLTHDGSPTLLNAELDWVYPEELALGTAHWWSPDSKRIAYLQFDVSREPVFPHADYLPTFAKYEPQRFPQPGTPNADVRLGVVSAAGGPTQWIYLGEPRDHLLARVYWSPNNRELAAVRLNRVQNRLELHFADAAGGSTRVVLREQDPYWINLHDAFRFLDGGQEFLWASERDGFRHLYVHGADGRQIRQLTRGEWEVVGVQAVDEKTREVFYLSSEAGPLEHHLYRVKLDGKGKQRLSQAPGTHAVSMAPAGAHYLDRFSSLTTPPRQVLYRRDGGELRVYREADPVEYDIPPTEIVPVKASDGARLYARLIRPAGLQEGRKHPVIVQVYGGPHAQSVRNAWTPPGWDHVMANRGFVVWQLDNRGTAGRGHQWESKVSRNLGAQELKDQQEGIRHLASLGFADTTRMGITGWSYGGYMTLYSLVNAPDLFQAGIAGAPVTDWRLYDTIYTERYMGLPEENPDGYKRSAPLTHAAHLKARLMLIHNLQDDNVHFQNTLQMTHALQQAGKHFDLIVYPLKSHGVTGPARKHQLEAMTGFFERWLK